MKKFFVLLLAAASITSCKKEDATGNTPDNHSSSHRLKRITQTSNGETTVYNLTYDANKRLSAVKSADNSEQTLFTYDAGGNVVKVQNREADMENVFEYQYSNGLPVKGFYKTYSLNAGQQPELLETQELQYTVSNRLVTRIKLLKQDEEDEDLDFDLTYTNGSLTRVTSNGEFGYSATFTYGTKKSPYPPVYQFVLDHAGYSMQFFSRNELLTETISVAGGNSSTINTQYTYDSKGFPLTANDGSTQIRFEYE